MRKLSLGLLLLAACTSSRDDSAASEAAATATSTELTPAVGTLLASGPSPNPQEDPAIAKGDGQYLAVWIEEQGVHAMRLDAQRKTLDDRSLLVGNGAKTGWDQAPAVAADGDGYLVAWAHVDAAGSSVRAARIEHDGRVLPTMTLATDATEPSVGWNGSEYLVAWTVATTPSIRAARVTKAGVVSPEIAVSATGPRRCNHSSIAAAKQTFLVAWEEPSGVRAMRLGVDAAPFTVVDHASAPAVASDGTSFWVATHPARGVDVTPVRDGVAGTTLSLDRATIGTPSVAWDGDSLIVAWEDSARRVKDHSIAELPSGSGGSHLRPAVADSEMILRIDVDGPSAHIAMPDGTPVARGDAMQRAPVAAFDGRRYLVVWEEVRTSFRHPEIWAAFVQGAVPAAPFRLGSGATPSVAWDGTKYTVMWHVDASHAAATSIDYAGVIEGATTFEAADARIVTGGGNSFVVANGGATILSAAAPMRVLYTSPSFTEVVWDGTSFLTAWVDGTTAKAAHFTSDWRRVEAAPVAIASVPAGASLHLAGDDHGTALIAWDSGHGIVGKRIATNALDPSPLRLDGTFDNEPCHDPVVTFDGARWLTAYRTHDAVELTHVATDGHRSPALTLGTGAVTMTSGPERETLVALESSSRLALRVLRDVSPGPTLLPLPTPPSGDDDPSVSNQEHGAPAFKAPSPRPGKVVSAAPPSDGCAMTPRSSSGSSGVLVALALLVSRRFGRRARVPHARR